MSKIKTVIVVGKIINYCIYTSPVGKLLLAGDEDGLQRIQFECNIEINHSWQQNNKTFKSVILQLNENHLI